MHAPQEAQELIELALAEAARHLTLEQPYLLHQRLELAAAGLGQKDALAATVARGASALDQARALEPVQQRHDAGLVHAEVRPELDLGNPGVEAREDQQAEQPRSDLALADETHIGPPRGLVGAAQ